MRIRARKKAGRKVGGVGKTPRGRKKIRRKTRGGEGTPPSEMGSEIISTSDTEDAEDKPQSGTPWPGPGARRKR
jgi:hypothetical protein